MTEILIIDDDLELAAMLEEYLQAEAYQTEHCREGESGVQAALSGLYDAVILDVMMPGIDGFEVLRRVRSQSRVPVLMLTAKGDDVDRIVGLEIGADDYLPKPFNPRELLARLRAILRRTQGVNYAQDEQDKQLSMGDLVLHPGSRLVTIRQQPVELTSTEFNLLQVLLKQAGQVVSKEILSQQALGRALEKYDRSIDMHMSNLRRKLASYDLDKMIMTVRGQGYQLSGEQL